MNVIFSVIGTARGPPAHLPSPAETSGQQMIGTRTSVGKGETTASLEIVPDAA
jgi:hypothetical protein